MGEKGGVMIKQIGKFRMHASTPYSWLTIEGQPNHITLSKDDLLDLKYATEFALREAEEKKKKQ